MTEWLLDTNVLSELVRPEPDPAVLSFLDRIAPFFISTVSLHELTFGAERLPEGRRKRALRHWLQDLASTFADTLIPVGRAEAEAAARLRAVAAGRGRTLHLADGLIAGTAFCHELALVTRNVGDFAQLDLRVVDPWQVQPTE